jgi:glucokinase
MPIVSDPLVGVDVGASTISAGLVRPDGTVLCSAQTPTDGPGPIPDRIAGLIEHVLERARERSLRVAGIGVGLPGPVDVEKGQMQAADGGWAPELVDLPLAAILRERSGHQVFVDNDVNALALSDSMFGPGAGAATLVTMAIGTAIGAGIILDGTLMRGRLNTAGEIGHVAVSLDGPRCSCGNVGCLNVYAGGRAMSERARKRLARSPGSSLLARIGGDPGRLSAAVLFEAAAEGDRLAGAIVDEVCEAVAIAVGALVNLLNPDVIVITGGVAVSLTPLAEDIRRRARRRALATVLDATAVHFVPGDKRRTVRGGAALVLYELARRDGAA